MRSQSIGVEKGLQVFAYGNSITAGTGGYTPFYVPMRPLVDIAVKTVWGYGRAGNTTDQLSAAWDSDVRKWIRRNCRSICILWEVTNAIATDAATSASQAFDQLGALCALAKLEGAKVICPNVIARTNFTDEQDALAVAFNTYLAAHWAQICDAQIDLRSNFNDSTDLAKYDADGTHINNTGQSLVGALLAPSVVTLATSFWP
jgi:hypothetical protein